MCAWYLVFFSTFWFAISLQYLFLLLFKLVLICSHKCSLCNVNNPHFIQSFVHPLSPTKESHTLAYISSISLLSFPLNTHKTAPACNNFPLLQPFLQPLAVLSMWTLYTHSLTHTHFFWQPLFCLSHPLFPCMCCPNMHTETQLSPL